MLKNLIYKEIHDSLVSSRFVLTFVLCATMTLLAIWTGAESYRRQLKNYAANKALIRQSLEAQPDYYSLRGQGVKVRI